MIGRAFRMVLVVCICLTGIGTIAVSSASASAGWSSYDGGWSGAGAVFLPHHGRLSTGSSGSGGNAGSSQAVWEIVPVCPPDIEPGTACDKTPNMGCTPPAVSYFLAYSPTGGSASTVTYICLAPGERPISEAELGQLVNERVRQIAPIARPGFQPRTAALTQLPTVFWSGQSGIVSRSESIAGFAVTFRATASWRWTWGDGQSTATNKPGGNYPNMSVVHVYRRIGTKQVRLVTTWTATFTVDSFGPFTATGNPVTQRAAVVVPVRQARATLVSEEG